MAFSSQNFLFLRFFPPFFTKWRSFGYARLERFLSSAQISKWILMRQTGAATTFFPRFSNIKCHPLVCLEDQIGHFVFARKTGMRGVSNCIMGLLWTNLDPVSLLNLLTAKKNITGAIETHPSQLHNLLYFSPSLPSLTFCRPPPPSFARFCDSRISSSRVSN